VVLATSNFRYLASAPKVHWQAAAEAPGVKLKFRGLTLKTGLMGSSCAAGLGRQ
jgi:hypothetical protein